MSEPKYYAVGEREELYATSIDEAIEEYLDHAWSDNSPSDLPRTVSVIGYEPRCVSESPWLFDQMIESMVETLDEYFGDPDGPSDYALSEEARQLFEAFKAKLIEEYPVWQCKQVGDAVEVDLAPYVAKMGDL